MKYVKLANTNLKVSQLCVGCMSFGDSEGRFYKWTLNYEESKKMIEHALKLGINFFDTANQYSEGTSEEYLGRALKELGVKRKDVVIATKVYFNDGKLSYEAIKRECELSLKRLQTDYIDLYQIHRFDYDHPMLDTLKALNELILESKVKAIGASAMYGYQFHNYQILAKENNLIGFSTMQNHYNLLYREDERELIPICKQYGVSLIPYSPLAAGHLTRDKWDSKSLRSQSDQTARKKYEHEKENNLEIIKVVKEIANKYNVSMTIVSLAWLFSKGCIPIIGSTKLYHYDEAIKALNLKLDKEDINKLEEKYLPHIISGARAS